MTDFAQNVLGWAANSGRKNLPWQYKNAYYIWLSEIMLQQTQVATVIAYFNRFIDAFPTIEKLAAATIDDVLIRWAGLGYYARARNIHKAAQIITRQYDGKFPQTFDEVMALPGIGASTAGAILALAFNQPHAILDGNVKRVLCRFHGIDSIVSARDTQHKLWQLARLHTPNDDSARYTQAIMDLGALVCKRKAECQQCPLTKNCAAFLTNRQHLLPIVGKKIAKPIKKLTMFVFQNNAGAVYLYKRPNQGIWGGMWSLPQEKKPYNLNTVSKRLGFKVEKMHKLNDIKHLLTHMELHIEPLLIKVGNNDKCLFGPNYVDVALPVPVTKILMRL